MRPLQVSNQDWNRVYNVIFRNYTHIFRGFKYESTQKIKQEFGLNVHIARPTEGRLVITITLTP